MNDFRFFSMRDATSTERQLRACGKIVHPSKKNASAVARKMGMQAYRCPLCHRWHIGHGRRQA